MKTAVPGHNPENVKRSGRISTAELVILAAILLATTLVRIRLLGVPLERDEGGFAYIARLILRGSPIYHDAYDFKPPGLYLGYAAIMAIFGHTPSGIHFGFLLINLTSSVLVYLIARSYFNPKSALIAPFLFALLSVSPNVLGFAGHATHLVVVCMLAGYYLLLSGRQTSSPARYILAGAAFGLAGMMKQPGILFLLAGGSVVFDYRRDGELLKVKLRRIMYIVGGTVAAIAVLCGWVAVAGDFSQFAFWNFTYGIEFGSRLSPGEAFGQLWAAGTQVVENYGAVWIIGAVGFALFFSRIRQERPRLSLAVFGVCSVAAVSAGFQFRSHYFVMALPAVALFSVYCLVWIRERIAIAAEILVAALLIVSVGWGVAVDSAYYFSETPVNVSRRIYFPNIFFTSAEIADTIRAQTKPTDRIAILGSEPEILFLADRQSATRYLFMYFLTEVHPYAAGMQRNCIREITESAPEMILLVRQEFSWGIRPRSERTILSWMTPYLKEHYEPIGLIDLPGPERVVTRWGKAVFSYPRLADADVLLFKRKP